MFTGLIESVGRVEAVTQAADAVRIAVASPLAADVRPGDSVAVNGVCLTMTRCGGGEMHADIGPETARITTLGSLRAGESVNLERSMRADSRVGGHFVQGHVDGVGEVLEIRPEGESRWVRIRFPEALAPLIVRKGAVAIDGISLTVADLRVTDLDVMIIPFTWEHTNLSSRAPGDRVNLECDMIGRYVARALDLSRLPG